MATDKDTQIQIRYNSKKKKALKATLKKRKMTISSWFEKNAENEINSK